MTQTQILIYTLSAMAGLSIGYFLGWLDEIVQPVVVVLLAIYSVERHTSKAIGEFVAYAALLEMNIFAPA